MHIWLDLNFQVQAQVITRLDTARVITVEEKEEEKEEEEEDISKAGS